MNQFRRYNKPSFLDRVWNISQKILHRKAGGVFFEFGASLIRFPKNIKFEENVYLKRSAIIGVATPEAHVSLGKNTTIGYSTVIMASKSIKVGRNVMIAPFVYIVDSNHQLETDRPFNQQGNVSNSISIADNVWIGAHTIILAGVEICKDCVIGANSTVTKSIKTPGTYAGNPAKLIRSHD
jgi:acetyltransferase-like isoleucine patch superfamily enzyme